MQPVKNDPALRTPEQRNAIDANRARRATRDAVCTRSPIREAPSRSVLDKTFFELDSSPTYARREVEFIPLPGRGEGLLTIRQWKGQRTGSKSESDTYQIQEEDAIGVMGRAFLLLNVSDDEQPDVYRCIVGPEMHCTCTAGSVKKYSCKHKDALSKLVAMQAI
jgi:hypothetical protein